jgi:hypothetical protein
MDILFEKKLATTAPSELKGGTHIFSVRKAYSLMFGLSTSPVTRENISIDLQKTSHSIARKEMVLDLNHCLLTQFL